METGEKIPEVLGYDADGREVKASDFADKPLIIYFYPKDNTPGCTAEACSLRDGFEELRALGYVVIGISKDSPKSHVKFAEKHSLPFIPSAMNRPKSIRLSGYGRRKKWPGASTWVPCAPLSSPTPTTASHTSSQKSTPKIPPAK